MNTITLKLEQGFNTTPIFSSFIFKRDENEKVVDFFKKGKNIESGEFASNVFKFDKQKVNSYTKYNSWVAISSVNPNSKFGRDLTFLNKSKAEGFFFYFTSVKENDVIEACKNLNLSNKYFVKATAKFKVIKKTENSIELEVL